MKSSNGGGKMGERPVSEVLNSYNENMDATGVFKKILFAGYNSLFENDDDFVILISGAEGVGKSTLSLKIARFLSKEDKIYLYASDIDALYFFDYLEHITKLKEQQKTEFKEFVGTIHIFDEAQNMFSRRRTMEEKNKIFDELLKSQRFLNQVLIFNTPVLSDIDITIIRRADMIIYIPAKGVANVYYSDRKEMLAFELEKRRRMTRYQSYATIRNIKVPPNLIIKFSRIDMRYYSKYIVNKAQNFSRFIKTIKRKYIQKVLKGDVVPLNDIAMELGIDVEFLQKYVKKLDKSCVIETPINTYLTKDCIKDLVEILSNSLLQK